MMTMAIKTTTTRSWSKLTRGGQARGDAKAALRLENASKNDGGGEVGDAVSVSVWRRAEIVAWLEPNGAVEKSTTFNCVTAGRERCPADVSVLSRPHRVRLAIADSSVVRGRSVRGSYIRLVDLQGTGARRVVAEFPLRAAANYTTAGRALTGGELARAGGPPNVLQPWECSLWSPFHGW